MIVKTLDEPKVESPSDKLQLPLSDMSEPDILITAEEESSKKWYYELSTWIKITLGLAVISFIILIIIERNTTVQLATDFLNWMRQNLFIGSLAFMAIYILCNVLMIPAFFLTIGCGFIFVSAFEQHSWRGIVCSIIIVSISRILGATLAFMTGRYCFSNRLKTWLLKFNKFVIINEIIKLHSIKVCFLLRLSPVTPYGMMNYGMAVATDVELKYFFWGNFGMIPDAITYCLVGASVETISELSSVNVSSNLRLLIITGIMTVVSLGGIIYVGCIAKRELVRMSRIVENDLRERNCNNNHVIDTDTVVDIDKA